MQLDQLVIQRASQRHVAVTNQRHRAAVSFDEEIDIQSRIGDTDIICGQFADLPSGGAFPRADR